MSRQEAAQLRRCHEGKTWKTTFPNAHERERYGFRALLAQALPSASSGVDWLYQFTNNLTNLTTQNGGALTQLGLTELSCISLFTLISMVVNWNTTSMTFRFHAQPVHAGDLTNFLFGSSSAALLENYWVNPFPGASFGINHFFSYIAQAMVAAFDQNSLDNLLQLLKTAGDNTAMPSLHGSGSDPLLLPRAESCLGLASAILFLINCSAFILYGVTALFGPIFVPLLMTKTFRAKFFHFLDVLIGFAMIRAVAAAFIFVWAGFMNGFHSADLQRKLFDGDVACESDSVHDGFRRLHHQHALHSEHDAGDLWRSGWNGWQHARSALAESSRTAAIAGGA